MDLSEYSILLPGRIVTFDASNQTATVKICAERITKSDYSDNDLRPHKVLRNVPVHTPSGGGWSFTVPIVAGDTCLLAFSQIGYDHWLYQDKDGGGTAFDMPRPWLNRKFSKQDSFALVGLNTLPRAIQGYSASNSEWRNSDRSQVITLEAGGDINIKSGSASIKIHSDGSIVLNTGSSVDITAPMTNINGDLEVTGSIKAPSIEATADLVVGSIDMGSHTHTENDQGGNTSGPS